jgi:hypothetical protein
MGLRANELLSGVTTATMSQAFLGEFFPKTTKWQRYLIGGGLGVANVALHAGVRNAMDEEDQDSYMGHLIPAFAGNVMGSGMSSMIELAAERNPRSMAAVLSSGDSAIWANILDNDVRSSLYGIYKDFRKKGMGAFASASQSFMIAGQFATFSSVGHLIPKDVTPQALVDDLDSPFQAIWKYIEKAPGMKDQLKNMSEEAIRNKKLDIAELFTKGNDLSTVADDLARSFEGIMSDEGLGHIQKLAKRYSELLVPGAVGTYDMLRKMGLDPDDKKVGFFKRLLGWGVEANIGSPLLRRGIQKDPNVVHTKKGVGLALADTFIGASVGAVAEATLMYGLYKVLGAFKGNSNNSKNTADLESNRPLNPI